MVCHWYTRPFYLIHTFDFLYIPTHVIKKKGFTYQHDLTVCIGFEISTLTTYHKCSVRQLYIIMSPSEQEKKAS